MTSAIVTYWLDVPYSQAKFGTEMIKLTVQSLDWHLTCMIGDILVSLSSCNHMHFSHLLRYPRSWG